MCFFDKKFFIFFFRQIIQILFILNLYFVGHFAFSDNFTDAEVQPIRYTEDPISTPSIFGSSRSDSPLLPSVDKIPKGVEQAKHSIWNIGYLFSGLIIDEGVGVFIASNIFLTDLHVMLSILKDEDNDITSVRLSKKDSPILLKVKHIRALSSNLVLIETEQEVSDYLTVRSKPLEDENSSMAGYLVKDSFQDIGIAEYESYFRYANHSVFSELIGSPVLDHKGQVIDVFHAGSGNTLQALSSGYLQKFIVENINKNINCLDFSCIEQELENLKNRADKGSAIAQFEWAYILSKHFNDHTEAFKYMYLSAEQDVSIALFYLSDMYRYGHGVPKDREKALTSMEKAADQDLVQAQNRSAYLRYQMGDIEEAVKWWTKAVVEQNSAQAKYNLADVYAKGEGVEQNSEKALGLLLSAAHQGLPQAQDVLASIHPNIEKSLQWEDRAVQRRTAVVE